MLAFYPVIIIIIIDLFVWSKSRDAVFAIVVLLFESVLSSLERLSRLAKVQSTICVSSIIILLSFRLVLMSRR